MFKDHSHRALRIAAALVPLAALGTFASPALATCPVGSVCNAGEVVAGTTQPTISLSASGTVGTPVAFTGFAPGSTATGAGALTAVDTTGQWTLTVADLGNGAGKMVQTGGTCTGSESQLSKALSVNVAAPTSGLPTGSGIAALGPVTLSGAPQTVATNSSSGAASQLLDGNVFTTNYSVSIPAGEQLAAGCIYGLTATYTLQ